MHNAACLSPIVWPNEVTMYVMDEDEEKLYLLHAFKRLSASARNIRFVRAARGSSTFDVELPQNAHVLSVKDNMRPRIPLKSSISASNCAGLRINLLAPYALNEEDFVRPFDISHITAVSVNDTSCFPWHAVSQNEIWMLDVVFQARLSFFSSVHPRYRSLFPSSQNYHHPALPLDNGIEELKFEWSLRQPTSDDDVMEFDTAVLQSLPALSRVKFVVNPSTWKEPNVRRRFPTRKSLLDDRREVFPRLAREKNRGLIEVWIGQIKVE
ncbi:hypothetical protein R3P38DRAFT_3252243 [Favolaschia claudopus]|uniref:Glycosyltransferase family 92 protein n=1 Tax=Favolaschia claudopus TaxID=2862362 RepID=A0AAW0E4M7_9AGAR